jgi:DNA helicase-2/ATP-dependent DNA helicase PcrA
MWTATVPSRFLDELPAEHVEVTEAAGGGFGMSGYGPSRFDEMTAFGSRYATPGWQRAQGRRGKGGFDETGRARGPAGGFDETGQARYVADAEFVDDDPDAHSDHLSPGGRGRAERAGEGDGRRRRAPSPQPSPTRGEGARRGRRTPLTIEGELIAKSTGAESLFTVGERVFHQKFGNGNVTAVDGNKLTIHFDKAGEKRVVDSFVERV